MLMGVAALLAACATPPAPLSHSPRLYGVAEADPPENLPGALSLEDAVSLALARNPGLRARAFDPLVAGAFLERERARFSPELFGEASRRESRSSETARATGEQFDAEVEQNRLSAGARREFATGTDVEIAARQLSETSNRAPDQEEARLSLSLTQALLRGGGKQANLIAVQRAEREVEISEMELRGFVEQLVSGVETAYWNFWLAHETIAITEQALAVAEQQLSDIQQRIEVGQLARNEEAAALAETARRRQALIDARADRVRRRAELLAFLSPMGGADEGATDPPLTLPEAPEPDDGVSLDERLALALRSRADLREAELRLEQRTLDTVLTRNGLLPRLDFFADLAKTGFGATPGDAWSDLDGNSYDVTAGLRFARPLGASREAAADREARFRRDQAEAAVGNMRQQVRTRLVIAVNELDRALRQVEASAETRRFQERSLEAEVERFQVGTGTALQVAQAQRDLLSAMIEEQRARVQARQALLDVHVAEGTLLERRGVAPEARP